MVLDTKKNSMSCFYYIRTVGTFTFLVFMSALTLTPSQFCLGCRQTDAVRQDNAPQVNALIRDLRDPKFAVREAATQRLIEVGPSAVDALRLASESDSLEVRVRAQTILASILQDQDSSFGSNEQAIIKQFKNAGAANRVAILRAQANSRNMSLLLHLLDIVYAEEAKSSGDVGQVESPIETLITADNVSPLTQLISQSLITRNWSDIDKLLSHPGILKYSPMLRVNQAQQAGELEVYIEDLFQKFSQAHAAQKTTSTRELVSLVGLFRVQRDFKRAETVIGWLPDIDLQRTLRNELVFQQGDWQEVLRRTKLEPADSDFISANLLQQALLHHLIGDEAAVADVKQQLRDELQTASEAADPAEEEAAPTKLLKTQLRIVGAITLDWPLMAEFFDPDNQADNFDLLVAQNRAAEALELLEVKPGFTGRQAWMKATLEEIDEAKKKMKNVTAGRGNEDYNKLKKIVSDNSGLALSVAQMMEQWGLDDEAQLYYQMIFAADKTPQGTNRTEITEQLLLLGRTDDYWELVASILSDPTHLKFMSRTWFGVKDPIVVRPLANQWAGRIRGAIVDPLKQTKTVAAVMNSPWVDREEMDFDLDFEMARFRSIAALNAYGSDEYMLAQVLELNGRDDEAGRMLNQSTMLGNASAIQRAYEQALVTNDDRGVLKYWIGAYNRSAESCLIAQRAALKLLETETDPEQIMDLKRQLKICRLAIAAQWIGGSTWNRGGFSQLFQMDESHLAILRLQCIVYGVGGDFLQKKQNHRHLGLALATEEVGQEYQGGIELATVIFNELAFTTGTRSDISWSGTSTMLNLALAQGLIGRGKYDEAADLLERLAIFSPGDVSLGEGTVKKLDQAGATEAADRVYQAVEKYFVSALEMYPDSPISRNNYAWLSATSNRDLESARRHAMAALKVRPNVEQYLDTLAEIEFLLGKPKEAFELSKRCVQLSPSRNYYRRQKERFRKAMSSTE